MPANRLLVWTLQKAVDLAIGVVVQLDLPHAELVGSALACPLGYLLDGIRRKHQIIVEIHESRHLVPLLIGPDLAACTLRANHVATITFYQSPLAHQD